MDGYELSSFHRLICCSCEGGMARGIALIISSLPFLWFMSTINSDEHDA
jgi:hypothetical protein